MWSPRLNCWQCILKWDFSYVSLLENRIVCLCGKCEGREMESRDKKIDGREGRRERRTKKENDLCMSSYLDSWHWSCETMRSVSSLEGIFHLNPDRVDVIDAQTGAVLNNLYHAGWPHGPRWALVCLWVVPLTHYPCWNSVVANGLDWGIGLSA